MYRPLGVYCSNSAHSCMCQQPCSLILKCVLPDVACAVLKAFVKYLESIFG
jgi:hypothetical protein